MKVNEQLAPNECGLGALALFYQHLTRRALPIATLRLQAALTPEGLSIKALAALGALHGLTLKPVVATLTDLRQQPARTALIALINHGLTMHYVLIVIRRNDLVVHDPLGQVSPISWSGFAALYRGYALFCDHFQKPVPSAQVRAAEQSWSRTATLFTLNLFFAALTILASLFIKALFDYAVPTGDANAVLGFVLIFSSFHLLRLMLVAMLELFVRRAANKRVSDYEAAYVRALFTYRYNALRNFKLETHLQALGALLEIATWEITLVSTVLSNSALVIATLAVMIALAPALIPLILVAAFLLMAINLYAVWGVAGDHQKLRALSGAQLALWLEILHRPLQTKHPGEQVSVLAKVTAQFATRQAFSAALGNKNLTIKSVSFILEAFLPLAIGAIGTLQVIGNQLSTGNLLLFINMTSVFLMAQQQLSGAALTFKPTRQRARELKAFLASAPPLSQGLDLRTPVREINLQAVKLLSLPSGSAPVNLLINDHLHVHGANGVGKSTLLLTLFDELPYSGTILVNKIDLKNLAASALKTRLLYLAPQPYLPAATLAEFWKLNTAISNPLREALETPEGVSVLNHLDLHLSFKIDYGGANLSLGQRQFINALAALQNNYELILNDEALDHLDATTLAFIQHAFAKQDKLFVEVSHNQKYFKTAAQKYEMTR